MGIIRFSSPDPEPPKESNITYRCDTEVITAVTLSIDPQKTPDKPAYARFTINGRTYSHNDIYIPEGNSRLVWVKWRTPKEPGYITITVTSNCNVNCNEIVAEIVDLDKNPPPDPQANDRNDGFHIPSKLCKPKRHHAYEEKSPTASGSHITGMQNVVIYFPEFEYATYWRLLKRLNTGLSSTFEFQTNKYSTYNRPAHFSPVWFPDGRYTAYGECLDAWTPADML